MPSVFGVPPTAVPALRFEEPRNSWLKTTPKNSLPQAMNLPRGLDWMLYVGFFSNSSQLAGTVPGVPSHRALPRAVVAFTVQVNQDFARLGAFAFADDAPVLQFVHDARGAAIAEAEAALQQRDARLLFAADDFDALLDDFLVLVNAALVAEA